MYIHTYFPEKPYLGVIQKIPHDWFTAQDASQGIILEISRCAKHKHSNWNYKFPTWQITLLYCNKKITQETLPVVGKFPKGGQIC